MKINTGMRCLIGGLMLAAGGSAAIGQVQVVYAIDAHAPGNVKTVVPGIEGATFKNFPRPFRSANGRRWVAVATINGFGTAQDQALVTGVGMNGQAVAQEGVTLDTDENTFAFTANIFPRITNDGVWTSAVSGGDKIVRGTLAGVVTPIAYSNSTEGAPADVAFGNQAFSSANFTAAGPAFLAGIGFSGDGANKMAIIGTTPIVSMPVFFVPTGQANDTQYTISNIDANSFWTNEAGTSWSARVTLTSQSTSDDKAFVVNGAVRIQEGTALPGMTGTVSSITDSFMESNGDWYARGSSSDSVGWAVKNGTVIAKTGTPIVPGSTDLYTSLIDVRGNGRGDYVIVGRTNNPDPNKTDVIVVNGKFVVARESDAIDLDGNGQVQDDMFLHIMTDRVMFADDGYVYFANRVKGAADATTDLPNSANSASLLRVAGCPADIGVAGGLAGADGFLDNNDFIAFISFFFDEDTRADRGVAGGLPGKDGAFDNNDFIAYINQFFDGC